jgi:hypothetical protein
MPDQRKYWLDDWRNVRKLLFTLYAVCTGLIALDLLYHKHVVLAFERWFGFYGVYGFVACVGLVLTAKLLRKVVGRAQDYYEGEADEDA